MKNILLLKEIYSEAFKNLGHMFIVSYLKIVTWFCFAVFGVVIYAFIYRLLTGFAFR